MQIQKKSIDISCLKGIGIIAVVVGHTSFQNLVPIIYYWHLPLFFFIIGLTYNWNKYERNTSGLIAARLHGFFPMYMCYMVILGLCHNLFFTMGILPEGNIQYGVQQGIDTFWNYLRLGVEPLAGALWFMLPWFYATLMYQVIVSGTSWMKIKQVQRQVVVLLASIVLAVLGFYCVERGYLRYDYADVALVVMPFVAVGGIYRCFREKIERYICLLGGGICLAVMLVAHYKYDLWTILDQRRYNNPGIFFLLAFCGIYCCLYLVKKMQKFNNQKIVNIIAKIGDYSMDIMTLHFVFFKLVDYVYIKCFDLEDVVVLNQFPHSFSSVKASIVYSIVGVIGPILVRVALNHIKFLILKVYSKWNKV